MAQDAPARPSFDVDGTVSVPEFELPPSVLASEEARAAQEMRGRIPVSEMTTGQNPEIGARRATLARMLQPRVDQMTALYPALVEETTIGGVPVRIITPAKGEFDPERTLINLHGGAFNVCWESCSLIESLPIAVLGGYRVVSVNYRKAPEFSHPAGVKDAAAVYQELLKEYDAAKIGVFGCSAGGALTAQLAAYLPQNNLPQMGAAGIFGAGAVRFQSGDSAYIAANIDGSFPGPDAEGKLAADLTLGYFDGVDMKDSVVSPALHTDVIAQFPPTLVTTGTRAMDLSPAIVTNSALLREGVESTLIVGEAMGHCYQYNPALPESRDAYAATVAHFRKHLD
ncbi:alpha/beta hydrolase fold domain-containing protein [Altererythrobacter aquaemixtae]|uniref:Alpha/beta hydrolase fold domain-containing protein n=2 Tax=Pontixanthobacter aquaemixtae TaxID=1958940 RepID=A0A844ZQ95_9SPHN|nr:alpha/beta hydrolase fold domain-containing protein [Pontixanthobacter aquaemixtae]